MTDHLSALPLTYQEIGATRHEHLPAGYHHQRHRVPLPHVPWGKAAEILMSWRVHRAAGLRLPDSTPPVSEGMSVVATVGRGPWGVRIPCRVVWVLQETARVGFTYGTLPGHPARGEEAFLLERDTEGRLWFTVTVFSAHNRWFTRLAGPLALFVQRLFIRRYATAFLRLCRTFTPSS